MVAGAFLLFRAFFKMLRDEEKEEKEETKESRTLRQSLIAGLALIITAFIGLILLKVMDYFMVIVSNLAGV